jgi:hypothetical protein
MVGYTGRLVMFRRYVVDPTAARFGDITDRSMMPWGKGVRRRHAVRESMSIAVFPLETMAALSACAARELQNATNITP